MVQSQVCIVSNPYLVSLDCLPNIDFITDDLRKKARYSGVPKKLQQNRKQSNMKLLTKLELSEVMNRMAQTRHTKKYTQSDSLNAKTYMRDKKRDKDKEALASSTLEDKAKQGSAPVM